MLMKSNKIYKLLNLCIVFLVLLSSCSKMNDIQDKYLKRGETIYVGKPDSVKILAGKGRVKIRYWVSDPKAAKLAVYWLSRTDSVIIDIPAHLANDSMEFIIPNLPEYNYTFELVTMNKDFKNRSVTLQKSGSSYGAMYQSTLVDRAVSYSRRRLYSTYLETQWLGSIENSIGCQLVYVNTYGGTVKRFVPTIETTTLITDLVGGVNYRTLYLPTPTAIDTFYTDFKPMPIEQNPELVMDKSKFRQWNPTGIPYSDLGSSYAITNLWNNSTATWFITPITAYPFSFTFDMGQTVKIRRFVQWQRLTNTVVYRNQNVKKWQLWGSASPNVTDSYIGWVYLGEFVSIKPSGLPLGQESAADIAYATAGESFNVDPNAPPVRYIRFVAEASWDGVKTIVTVGEMTFYEWLY